MEKEKCSRIFCKSFCKGKDLKPCKECQAKDKIAMAKNKEVLDNFFQKVSLLK